MCPESWIALIVDLDQIRVSPYRPVALEATTEGLTHEGNRSHVLKSEIPCIYWGIYTWVHARRKLKEVFDSDDSEIAAVEMS
jgi:hypothetical protein